MKLRKRILKEILEFGKLLLFALVVSLFIRENVVASGYVPTGSMEDTVMKESRILINRLSYAWEDPQRGDIVAFHYPDNPDEIYLKRVIGLPGETIEGYDGTVYINGTPLLDDFTQQKLEQNFGPFNIPEGCYFMMGDNRNNSWDSRYWKNHYVEKDQILGKVSLEYYPELKRLK
ncbi:MAG: signal peptidase I [Lachnospiraceae bacterium]|nr:signal peptidase I [Lachnospiraceae bacterium]